MGKIRAQTWIGAILAVIALPFLFFGGLWVFMTATAKRLHPNLQAIPAVAYAEPLPQWSGAVERGRRMARESLAEQNLPGLSVAVGIGNDVVWAEGFGFADLEIGLPVTPRHRFPIGTASTVLTSAAAGLLVESGRMKLDSEIQTYVPQFPKKQWPVTLRQLMGHTSGFFADETDGAPLMTKHCGRPVEAVQYFSDLTLGSEPGTEYRYSNHNWILVSAAIEEAAGEPFLTLMRERVFEPLGMRDTVAEYGGSESSVGDARSGPGTKASLAAGSDGDRTKVFFPRFMTRPRYGVDPVPPVDYSCYAGASAFLSTPTDMVRFGMEMESGKLLRPSTVEMVRTSQRLTSGKETGHGLGWDVDTVSLAGKETRTVGRNGDTFGGMVSSFVMIPGLTNPERGVFVSVMANISYADTLSLAKRIAQVFAENHSGRN